AGPGRGRCGRGHGELDHALGLNHEDRWIATLNSFHPNGGPSGHAREWAPMADDRAGVRFLYPDATTETDIAASVFKWSGSGNSTLVSSPATATHGSRATMERTFDI